MPFVVRCVCVCMCEYVSVCVRMYVCACRTWLKVELIHIFACDRNLEEKVVSTSSADASNEIMLSER